MDLIFKRYQNPFLFLNNSIENSCFGDTVFLIYEQENEEQLWQIYLHTVTSHGKSYEEWKNEVTKRSEITKIDVETAIKKSDNILKNIKPRR